MAPWVGQIKHHRGPGDPGLRPSRQRTAWGPFISHRAWRRDLKAPERAIGDYVAWVKRLPGKPVFVAYPAGFDFTFLYW